MAEQLDIKVFENTFKNEAKKDGSQTMQTCLFTKKFGDGEDEWPVEADRYRLLWMPACPHAHKVVIVRTLLGLDNVISLGATGPFRTPQGWVFSEDPGEVDPVLGIHYLQDLYLRENPNYEGRPTVPIIADTKTVKGVNNDHFWLTIYLETAWKKLHKDGAPDLYPEAIRNEIDELNKIIYENVNVGFYNLGFARSQSAYEKGYEKLFDTLEMLDARLEHQRYLFGDKITDSDVRLYPSLVRYDVVYYFQFRANKRRLREFKNLWAYARDLYQIPEFAESTDFNFIKRSYQLSPHLRPLWGNEYGILSKGPEIDSWSIPHGRESIIKTGENEDGSNQS